MKLTKSPAECPDVAAYVEVEFIAGVPVAVNGVSMPLVELIASLETIAGRLNEIRREHGAHSVVLSELNLKFLLKLSHDKKALFHWK